jgi:hypothetical protein
MKIRCLIFFANLVVCVSGFCQDSKPCRRESIVAFERFINHFDTIPYSLLDIMDSSTCLKDTLGIVNNLMSFSYSTYDQTRLAVSTHKIDKRYYGRNLTSKNQPSHSFAPRSKTYPVEAIKLYFIYALFRSNFEFSDSICLKTKRGTYLSFNDKYSLDCDSTITRKKGEQIMMKSFDNYKLIRKAESSYRKWLTQLNKLGMDEMRKRNWHPLYWSNLTW